MLTQFILMKILTIVLQLVLGTICVPHTACGGFLIADPPTGSSTPESNFSVCFLGPRLVLQLKDGVLASYGCHNEVHQTGWLKITKKLVFHSSEGYE